MSGVETTAATIESLIDSALRRSGLRHRIGPASHDIGKEEWLPEAVQDFLAFCRASSLDGTLKSLETASVLVLEANLTTYALPDDFDVNLTCVLYDGDRGACQGASANTIQFASDEAVGSAAAGRKVFITSGAAQGECRVIVSYDTATVTATVSAQWENAVVAGDTYLIADEDWPLDKCTVYEAEDFVSSSAPAKPSQYAVKQRQLVFERPPDQLYAVEMSYFADPTKRAYSDPMWQLIADRWRGVLVKSCSRFALQQIDDSRADKVLLELTQVAYPALLAREQITGDEPEAFVIGE